MQLDATHANIDSLLFDDNSFKQCLQIAPFGAALALYFVNVFWQWQSLWELFMIDYEYDNTRV